MIIPIVLQRNKDNKDKWQPRTYTPDQVEEKIIQNIYETFANELVHESGLKVDCVRMPDGKVKVQVRKDNRACVKCFEVDRTPVAKGNWR